MGRPAKPWVHHGGLHVRPCDLACTHQGPLIGVGWWRIIWNDRWAAV